MRFLKRKGPRRLNTFADKSIKKLHLQSLADLAKTNGHSLRRRSATIAVGCLAVLMGYGVLFGHNGLTVFAHKRTETKDLQEQMQRLQVENDRLKDHVDRLQNDPGAIEHQAREELHYTRAGEVIYTLPPKPGDTTAVPLPAAQ